MAVYFHLFLIPLGIDSPPNVGRLDCHGDVRSFDRAACSRSSGQVSVDPIENIITTC